MAQSERYGNRDGERAYSAFHRVKSACRYISYEDAERLATINLDRVFWIETHNRSFEPIALVETAMDIEQMRKSCTAVINLAMRAEVLAYLVLYKLGDRVDPITSESEIVRFRVKRLWPGVDEFKICSPQEYLEGLIKLRQWAIGRIIHCARTDRKLRNHDTPRLLRKIEQVSPQFHFDFW